MKTKALFLTVLLAGCGGLDAGDCARPCGDGYVRVSGPYDSAETFYCSPMLASDGAVACAAGIPVGVSHGGVVECRHAPDERLCE